MQRGQPQPGRRGLQPTSTKKTCTHPLTRMPSGLRRAAAERDQHISARPRLLSLRHHAAARSFFCAPFLHLALPSCCCALQNAVISEQLQHAPPSLFFFFRGFLVDVLVRVRQTSAHPRSGSQYETGAANIKSLCSKTFSWSCKTSASSGIATIVYFRLESPPFERRKTTRLNDWTGTQISMTKPHGIIT